MIFEGKAVDSVSQSAPRILVTVGTSLPHDELIQAIDNLVGNGTITDEVIAQIGEGKYRPHNIEFFRFAPSLKEYFEWAGVVLSNCGAGTIMENVTNGRRLVVIQNPGITGGHEWELVSKMEKGNHLVWCKNIESLHSSIEDAKRKDYQIFLPMQLDIHRSLTDLLAS